MDIYRKLPKDLQKIIDRMIHEIDYSNVVNQIYTIFRNPKYIVGSPRILSNLFNGHIYNLCNQCVFHPTERHINYSADDDSLDLLPYYYDEYTFLPSISQKIINDYNDPSNYNNHDLEYTDIEYYKYKEKQIEQYGFVRRMKLI